MRLAIFLLLAVPTAALAQDATESAAEGGEDEGRARALFNAGQTAFGEGRFAEAAGLWVRAYELSPRGALLYNIGNAYDRAGANEEALVHYRRYLEADPDTDKEAYLRSRIAVLEGIVASEEEPTPPEEEPDEDTAAQPAATEPAVTEPTESSGRAVLGGVLLGAAAAFAVVGAGTGGRALRERKALDGRCPEGLCPESERSRADRTDRLALTTDIMLGAAGLVAVTGLLLLLLGSDDEDGPRPSIACDGVGCAFSLRGRF